MSLGGQACGTAKHTAEIISTSGFQNCLQTKWRQIKDTQTWWNDWWRCKRHWRTIVVWVVSPSGIVKHVVGVVERSITSDGSISFSKLEIWVVRCCCCCCCCCDTSHWSGAIHRMLSSCPSINIVVALL